MGQGKTLMYQYYSKEAVGAFFAPRTSQHHHPCWNCEVTSQCQHIADSTVCKNILIHTSERHHHHWEFLPLLPTGWGSPPLGAAYAKAQAWHMQGQHTARHETPTCSSYGSSPTFGKLLQDCPTEKQDGGFNQQQQSVQIPRGIRLIKKKKVLWLSL